MFHYLFSPLSISPQKQIPRLPIKSRLLFLMGKFCGMFKLVLLYIPILSNAWSSHAAPNVKSIRSPWREIKNRKRLGICSERSWLILNLICINWLSELGSVIAGRARGETDACEVCLDSLFDSSLSKIDLERAPLTVPFFSAFLASITLVSLRFV